MNWNKHSNIEGSHAFLGASRYHWLNYDEERLIESYRRFMATARGTKLHDFAATCLELGQKLPKSDKTLNMYVNDGVRYRMTPEQPLYYTENCFGTTDSISFDHGVLRIHDLKTGEVPAHIEQLLIYAALFCTEYGVKPAQIDTELRIYQNDEVLCHNPQASEITDIIDKMKWGNSIVERLKKEDRDE